MGDASVRFIASGLAIAVGIGATTRLVDETTRRRIEIAASPIAADLGRRALRETSRAGHDASLSTRSDADAATALCRRDAVAALLERALTPDEIDACRAADLRPVEARVAFAVAAIAVPVGNDFVDALSIDQLRMIFGRSKGQRLTFRDLDLRWPNIEVVARGVESAGAAPAILERRLGTSALSFRGSASAAEVAAAIEAEPGAIGFFGSTQPGALAHALRLVPIRNADGDPIYPTRDALESESYPLGATLWLASEAGPAPDDLETFHRSWSASLSAVASSADCLAFVERMPRERIAGR